jgi:hypothetical protein
VSGALESAQHGGRPERDRVDADDPERLRPTGHQRRRGGVRAIVQLAHRQKHPLASVPAHVFACVDDARDGLLRDADELGHVTIVAARRLALSGRLDELIHGSMTHHAARRPSNRERYQVAWTYEALI